MYPDLLVVGTQKAGTTWLYRNLATHPQIWVPPIKEIHYFDYWLARQNIQSIRRFRRRLWRKHCRLLARRSINGITREHSFATLFWSINYLFGRINDPWYASLFATPGGKLSCDMTPDYHRLNEQKIAHINDLMPQTRILFLLRNPIERAWSHAKMAFKQKNTVFENTYGRLEDVSDALFLQHFHTRSSRQHGDYQRSLSQWGRFYPRDRIFIGFMEDIMSRPLELLSDIGTFLDIDPSPHNFSYDVRRKVNADELAIPAHLGRHLADMYYRPIQDLAALFEGRQKQYIKSWIAMADDLLANGQGALSDRSIQAP